MARRRDAMSHRGFTLIELVVAMGISLALGIGGFLFFRTQVRSLIDQSAGLDAIEGARAALDFMAYEIRQAGSSNGACSASTPLSSMSSTGLTITYCNTSASLQTIIYAYDSGLKRITRSVNGSSATTLISNVPSGGLSFVYYDSSDASTATASNVASIKLTVQVQAARATTVTTTTLYSRVALRNRALTHLGVQG
jgi:prepilin-type N-terminal cleavage/methylation domain-containing protein